MDRSRFRSGDAVALLTAVVLMVMVALDVRSPVRTALALLFVFWVPGSAVSAWLPNLTPAEHRGIAVTLSLAVGLLIPTGAVWLHWWHPMTLFHATAAVSIVALVLSWRRSDRLVPRLRWSVPRLPAALLAIACGAGAVAFVQLSAHDHAVGRWGLLTQLPIAWFVGAVAVVAAAAVAFRMESSSGMAGSSMVLVALLHATSAIAYTAPRFTWTYKHLGVTDYILANGHASSGVDIYNNWPGFFSMTAHLFTVAGVHDPMSLLRWWPAVIGVATVVVLRFFFGALTDDRRIQWGAVGLFVVANWFGQDYFAPQSVAFVVAFGVFGLLLRTSASPERLQFTMDRNERTIYAVAALVSFVAIVVTHQLTPYLMLPGLAVAALIGGIRPKWLVLVCTLIAVAYLVPRFDWVQAHGGLGHTSVGDNVRTHSADLVGEAWSVTVSNWASRILTAALVIGSIPYVFRFRRDRWWTVLLLSNLIGPAAVLLVQAYGNEGVLRSALFVTPWMAFAAVASIVHRRSEARPARGAASVLFGLAVAAGVVLFAFATWGLDVRYRVDPGEVRIEQAFESTAPAGAVLAQLGPQHLPVRMTARYPQFDFTVLTPFAEGQRNVSSVLRQLEAGAERVSRRRAVYIASTSSADRFSSLFGYGDGDNYAALRRAIARSSRWELVIANSDDLLARYNG